MINPKFIPMKPKRIIVHCSATPNGKSVDIDTIRIDHIKNRGFTDVGYHELINVDGQIQHGRPLNVQGAHCEGNNSDSIGICLVGTDKFSKKQLDALRYQISSIVQIFDIGVQFIYSHNEFDSARKQGKTCPGFSSTELLAWYLVGAKSLDKNILE